MVLRKKGDDSSGLSSFCIMRLSARTCEPAGAELLVAPTLSPGGRTAQPPDKPLGQLLNSLTF